MIAAGKSNGICWGNISDGLPLHVAGPVPCDERHTVPYQPPWDRSSYAPSTEEETATTYEACQSYTVSGLKYENIGAQDGIVLMVKQPWGKIVEVCGEEAPTPEAAKADLQRVLAGMNGTTGIARSNCTFVENCTVNEQGDVQMKEHTSFWDSVFSFFRRFGQEVAETPSYGGG